MATGVYVLEYKDHHLVRGRQGLPVVVILLQLWFNEFLIQFTCLFKREPVATSSCREVLHRPINYFWSIKWGKWIWANELLGHVWMSSVFQSLIPFLDNDFVSSESCWEISRLYSCTRLFDQNPENHFTVKIWNTFFHSLESNVVPRPAGPELVLPGTGQLAISFPHFEKQSSLVRRQASHPCLKEGRIS